MNTQARSHLEQRGIYTTALAAGWTQIVQRGITYYRYPVYAPDSAAIVAYRLKALPNQTGAKYLWVEGKPEAAAYYRHPGVNLQAAIAAANGVLYIANGEPSVLAYAAGGVLNALSWFGEGSVPAALAQDLQRFGVREVRYPADKDEAGRKSAAKVRDVLRGTTITFRALAWGDDVPEKGDANDLWRVVGFDAAEFQRRLMALTALILPENADGQGQGDAPHRPYNLVSEGVHPDLIAAIGARLGVTGFRANGWSSRNVISPFREEKRASAAFNRESGVLHDFGSGESYSAKEVADKLGVDWRVYQPQTNITHRNSRLVRENGTGRGGFQTRPYNHDPSANPPSPFGEGGRGVRLIHQRWTSEIDPAEVLRHRTILLRAPMATGKTELVKRLMGHMENVANVRAQHAAPLQPSSPGLAGAGFKPAPTNQAVPRILYVNHLKSLTAHAAERLGLELYDNIPAEYLPMASNMAISYNSLHKLLRSDGNLPLYDLLVVDECEQVQPYIGAATFRPGEALRNYGIFRRLVAQAKHVLFMDAHAGEINADWLHDMRGDCQVIHNTFRHDWGRLTFHESSSGAVGKAISLMKLDQGCVVIPTNSRSFSETLYHHLTQLFGSDGILLVNSENSESAAVQHVTVHINDELPKLRALICSPSYSTGLDVTAPVRAVCGVFFQQPTLPSDNLQMMGRYRNAQERHAYVQPCERDLLTDEKLLYRHELSQSMRTAAAAEFAAYELPAVEAMQAEILRLQCRYEAAHNRQRQNMLVSFRVLAEAEGYTLEQQEGDAVTLAMQLKISREAVAEARKQRTLAAEPVTRDLLDGHRQRGTLTPEIRAGHERYLIEDTLGLPLTPELYDRFRRPADRRALRRFTDLTTSRMKLQERDRAQAAGQILIRARSHYTEAQDLVTAVMGLLDLNAISRENGSGRGGFETRPYDKIAKSTSTKNQAGHFTPSPSGEGAGGEVVAFREAEIEQRAGDYVRANLARIQRVIDGRYDLSMETLPVVKRILKSVGLAMQGRQVMVNRERFYVYGLDEQQLAAMNRYAAARRTYLAEKVEPVTQNTRHRRTQSRVLSNTITALGGLPGKEQTPDAKAQRREG